MIYKQCNYYILLLLYDFEWEIVEIKQTWNLNALVVWHFKTKMKCYHYDLRYEGNFKTNG